VFNDANSMPLFSRTAQNRVKIILIDFSVTKELIVEHLSPIYCQNNDNNSCWKT